jgi:glycosidase
VLPPPGAGGAPPSDAGGLPLAFDFPLAEGIIQGVLTGNNAPVARALDDLARADPAGAVDAPFLSNHDQLRIASRLGGDPSGLRLAPAILLTLQGTPFLYYGEEIGLAQDSACQGDACKRAPMAWDGTASGGFTSGTPWQPLGPGGANVAAQTGDPASLLSRYRTLLRLRKGSEALAHGGTVRLATGDGPLLAFLRTAPGETVLVAHDLGFGAIRQDLALDAAAAEPLLVDPGAALSPSTAAGRWTVALPARGSGVWRLR